MGKMIKNKNYSQNSSNKKKWVFIKKFIYILWANGIWNETNVRVHKVIDGVT